MLNLLMLLLLLLDLMLLNLLLLNLLLLLLSDGLLFQVQARDPREREWFRRVKVTANHDLRRIRRLIDLNILHGCSHHRSAIDMAGCASSVVSIVSDEPRGRLCSCGTTRPDDTAHRAVLTADPQIIRRLLPRFSWGSRSCRRTVACRRIGWASGNLADGCNQLAASAGTIVSAWRRRTLIRIEKCRGYLSEDAKHHKCIALIDYILHSKSTTCTHLVVLANQIAGRWLFLLLLCGDSCGHRHELGAVVHICSATGGSRITVVHIGIAVVVHGRGRRFLGVHVIARGGCRVLETSGVVVAARDGVPLVRQGG